ncbi:MAG: DNA polymerase III subunit gamma/tau [Deltaproteobacteria bacterium]|nr:DNA polymerase III subunit gamma/tau [Deltaproteobacteria bacterium]
MGYLVLARKWRPQTFADVVGQDHVINTLKNAIKTNRIAHAYIFGGQRGVGKTSIARIFAKALNCVNGPTEFPCNACSHCLEIAEGISIDCREIDGASNRGIDEIRELKENIKFSPISSQYKINIIDEVHMLSREAFNALLKTLEEPPAHVIFIFATTEMRKIPATILSRCQYYDFRRVSVVQLVESLLKIAQAEGISISNGALSLIAEAGDGSMRDAQSIFDQVIAYAGKEIDEQAVASLLGVRDKRFLFDLSTAIFTHDAVSCFTAVEDAYYSGIDLEHFYHLLMQHFRNMLLCKVMGEKSEIARLSVVEYEEYQRVTSDISLETLQRYLDILLAEEESVIRGGNPRVVIEMVILRMVLLEPLIPLEGFLARLSVLEKGLRGTVSSAPVAQLTPSSFGEGQSAFRNEKLLDKVSWRDFLKTLKGRHGSYWRWLGDTRLDSCGAGIANIAVDKNPIIAQTVAEILQEEDFRTLFADFFGYKLSFSVTQQVLEAQDNDASDRLETSPITKKILSVYPAAEVTEVKRRG